MVHALCFDNMNHLEPPTLLLANRNGYVLGLLQAENIKSKGSMISADEISFTAHKFIDGVKDCLWDNIVDYKLVWYKEVDVWFELKVDIDETNETIKNVVGTQLEYAELGQIKLFSIEINTEADIARDDYEKPTVLYDPDHPEISLLHRIGEKAKHYEIAHVDTTIKNIQRSFSFDDITILESHQQIAEEIGCLFVYSSYLDEYGKLRRTYSVYDLQSNCRNPKCNHRGEFTSKCPKCGGIDIDEGFGEDTTIFITANELAEEVRFSTDTDSVKNCFKLEAGDELMMAVIRSCNPNGTDYLWHISKAMKEDMSDDLVNRIEEYEAEYSKYETQEISIDSGKLSRYNGLIEKYSRKNTDLEGLPERISGYAAMTEAYFNTIDFKLYLESSLMPSIEMSEIKASDEIKKLTASNLSPVAVPDISVISKASADSAVLSMAKILVNSRYKIRIISSDDLVSKVGDDGIKIWNGRFAITNFSDEDDNAETEEIEVEINDDYEQFIKQKLELAIRDEETDDLSFSSLFKLNHNDENEHEIDPNTGSMECQFCNELTKYSLNRLKAFYDACQACIDILIEQGIGNEESWSGKEGEGNLYQSLYLPYYNKLNCIDREIKVRETEIKTITQLQSEIEEIQTVIHQALNFEDYLGKDLWCEFCAYRREDKYSNANYISDGLNNSELFQKGFEFWETARNEIYKSAELQHSITSSLKNLLGNSKFKVLLNSFMLGNWLRVECDDGIYKLRFLEYEIDHDSPDSIAVEFSDVTKIRNGISDQQFLISKMAAVTGSYGAVQRQAKQGSESKGILDNWVEDGLDATNIMITGGSKQQTQKWDSHGMLFRAYDPITETYAPEQTKIINSTIAITNDNWKTTKTAIGLFSYRDPSSGELKKTYGINGETIVGKFLLGENLSMQNSDGSLVFNDNGLIITSVTDDGIGTMEFGQDGLIVQRDNNMIKISPQSNEIMDIKIGEEHVFLVDDDGNLRINGHIMARSLALGNDVTIDSSVVTGLHEVAFSGDYTKLDNLPNLKQVATTGDYNDLLNLPTLFDGKYSSLIGAPNLAKVATSGSYNDLLNLPSIAETVVQSNTSNAVSGKAVYDYALPKSLGSANANKILYTDTNGNASFITISSLKTLLGIE